MAELVSLLLGVILCLIAIAWQDRDRYAPGIRDRKASLSPQRIKQLVYESPERIYRPGDVIEVYGDSVMDCSMAMFATSFHPAVRSRGQSRTAGYKVG
jgi:hypothetical protein